MLQFEELKKYLPYRFPMLMVDRVLDYESGKRLKALKNVNANDISFFGHFPEMLIMPGTLILEGIGQCCAILFQLTFGQLAPDEVPLFGSVSARFLCPVFPGDQLFYEVEAEKLTSYAGVFKGVAKVEDKVAVKFQMTMGKRATTELNGE
jgi:3-hydroxyacyl-[acyl-carrier-protein] dehydratase